jgi:hypothetical protein
MFPPFILLAFRFHGNFYHSCRDDTPDEMGFGKDIRVIRHLIETLDELNGRGIPVRGTWDFENAVSLGRIMPAQCMGRVNFGPALMDRKGIVGKRTLHIPTPLLRHGKNEIVIFELHGAEQLAVELRDKPELG